MLVLLSASEPEDGHQLVGLDASKPRVPAEKAILLGTDSIGVKIQASQLENPDSRVILDAFEQNNLLSELADFGKGSTTGDRPRFLRCFWEVPILTKDNQKWLDSVDNDDPWSGREHVTTVAIDSPEMESQLGCWIRGREVWSRPGVALNKMRVLQPYFYAGELFDDNVGVIAPHDESHVAAIWCYAKSGEHRSQIRKVDQQLKVTAATLTKVPFELERWQRVAAEEYPQGLPKPFSNDPTQWFFKGHPKGSTDPLQVTVARLLGYHWPDQEADKLDALADGDGIVPIPSVRGEPPAEERLREVLKAAFGPEWSASLEHKLLTESGASSGTTLDDWLRNSFFEQHCKKFHQRPFIWHIWDGRKDGFSCLVNYHKLTHNVLDNLTHSYVQDWINLQAADARNGKPGADLRLAAAQDLQEKLKLILAGEPPHDIFVRWKPLSERAIGWNPDLNDGVRMNIRPFVEAGILRKPSNIKWTKDRGKEPHRPQDEYPWFWTGDVFTGDRVNDVHITNAQKQAARKIRSCS